MVPVPADDGQPTEESVQGQLDEILASPGFLQAPQLASFLRFVVVEALAGRADQIKQYTVATRAFGRTPDFDPESDPIVRITARRLRRALAEYYQAARNAPVHIDIPKGGYVPRFRPLVADTPLDPKTNATDDGSHRGDGREASSRKPSIAILPFTNLGSDPELAYFAVGLTTLVVEELTRYPAVTVIGPLSRVRLAEAGMDARAIGSEYGVRFVLDGLIRPRRDGAAVSMKLIDTDNAATIWAETYGGNVSSVELFELEEKIASQAVAVIVDDYGALSRVLMAESYQRPANQLQTYDAVLRGIHALTFLETYMISVGSRVRNPQ